MADEFGRRFALLADYAHKQGNMRSIHIVSVSLFLMTGGHFRITDAFTDAIGAAGGHRGRFAPVCSFHFPGASIAPVEATAAGAALAKPVGLAMTSQRCAPHHYPLGGHSGAVICLLCAISANYYLCSTR